LIHYLERGRGEPLLLIHGLGSSGADWALQAPCLEERYRLIVPDISGSGHSEPLRAGYSVEGMAAAIWALCDHLAVGRGHPRPLEQVGGGRPHIVAHSGHRHAARRAARRLFPMPWQGSLRERAAAAVSAAPAARYLGTGRALLKWSAVELLERLKAKALVIAAENDFTPLEEKRALALRLGAEFMMIRGSRHSTPFDSVRATNEALRSFLNDQPLPPAERWIYDDAAHCGPLPFAGSIAEEHAFSLAKRARRPHAR
jgi:3-oxoadipate enol-lactonase